MFASRPALFVGLLTILASGCVRDGSSPRVERRAPSDEPIASVSTEPAPPELVVLEPILHGNLAVFPVVSRVLNDQDRFITLDEGLRAGTVEVTEVGSAQPATPFEDPASEISDQRERGRDSDLHGDVAGNVGEVGFFGGDDVNSLVVVNRSELPLYLMPGEILVGGHQDRCIAEETIVPPGGEPTRIDVYCVEHGRWGARDVGETLSLLAGNTAENTDEAGAATEASHGKFVASVGHLNKRGRLAAQEARDQGRVWEEVAVANASAGRRLASGAFTGNYALPDEAARLSPYLQDLQEPIGDTRQVVGVVVAINGKIESMDVFDATPLFRKLWPKLLKGYALDAANAASDAGSDAASENDSDGDPVELASREDASRFLDEALTARVEQSDVKNGIAITKRSSDSVVSFGGGLDGGGGGFGGGGFGGGGGGFHAAGFSK